MFRGRCSVAAACVFGTACLLPAQAQDVLAGSGLTIGPTFSMQETLTSNRDLSSSNPQADAITRISPGFHIGSAQGRVRGSLSYALNALFYARSASQNNLQNSLDGTVTAEVVENHAFIDAKANISQTTISAYGQQSSDPALVNSNRTEVASVSVSPRVRGNIGGYAAFDGSLNWSTSSSSSTKLGDSTSRGGQAGLSGSSGRLGWSLNASHQVSSYRLSESTTSDQYGGSLSFTPTYDVNLSLRAGRSASNILTGERVWSPTYGGGLSWQPTERTDVSLQADHTEYGRSHSYSLRHRMASSVWSYTDSTSVTGVPSGQGTVQPLTIFDLLYSVCLAGGGTAGGCDQSVRADLARQNLDPAIVIVPGFLGASPSLARFQVLAVSYAGLRTSLTLSASRSSFSTIGTVAPVAGDLQQGAPVHQQGVTLGLSHRLTETSSMTVSASEQKTLDSGLQAGNQQQMIMVSWTFTPGPRSNVTLSARHQRFQSETNPYQESALIGSLDLRF